MPGFFTALCSPSFRTTLRQWLVLQAFLVWQGGFVFYAGVVVPTGTDLLGSAKEQGFITQIVTDWLNLIGVGWHVILFWDWRSTRDPKRLRRRWRFGCWLASLLLLVSLVLMHLPMDQLLDRETGRLHDRTAFRRWHIAYLWASTIQWLLALGQAWMTLRAWEAAARDPVLPAG